MPRRKIELDIKVETMRECLRLVDVAAIVRKHGVSKQAAYNWYQRVLEALPDLLVDKTPGRKPAAEKPTPPPL